MDGDLSNAPINYNNLTHLKESEVVDYCSWFLERYKERMKIQELREHISGIDSEEVARYPGDVFKTFLKRYPYDFVVFDDDDTVSSAKRECCRYFSEKLARYGKDGVHYMHLKGHIGQAPSYIKDYIHSYYHGKLFLQFLTDNEDVFTVDGNKAYLAENDSLQVRPRSSSVSLAVDDVSCDLETLLKSKKNSDITLQVEDREFLAHKLILGARSPVFAAMFEHNFQEGNSGLIKIPDISAEVVEDLLLYIYTGKVKDLSSEKGVALYEAADKYDLKRLKEKCREFLLENLSVDSVCELSGMADQRNDGVIIDAVKNFIHKNSDAVLSTKKWMDLVGENPKMASEILRFLTSKLVTK